MFLHVKCCNLVSYCTHRLRWRSGGWRTRQGHDTMTWKLGRQQTVSIVSWSAWRSSLSLYSRCSRSRWWWSSLPLPIRLDRSTFWYFLCRVASLRITRFLWQIPFTRLLSFLTNRVPRLLRGYTHLFGILTLNPRPCIWGCFVIVPSSFFFSPPTSIPASFLALDCFHFPRRGLHCHWTSHYWNPWYAVSSKFYSVGSWSPGSMHVHYAQNTGWSLFLISNSEKKIKTDTPGFNAILHL